MKTIRTIEFNISADTHQKITELHNICSENEWFRRSYFKQLPHFRYLVFAEDILVAHMGVDHRVIRVGDFILTIFGTIDLFVKPSHRRQGIASELLKSLEKLARKNKIDFLFLVSGNDLLYLKNGFQAVSQECSWLGIEEHQNCGVLIETIEENFMIKQMGNKPWVEGRIDLLGYMF